MYSLSRLFFGSAALLSFFATQLPLVSAHGYVSQLVIDGQTYIGPNPYQNPISSPIRQISDVSPIKDVTSKDLACGLSAKPASLLANVTSGSKIEIHWTSGNGGNWPHEVGPLMTYIANCANNDCTTDTAATSQWVKIDEAGQKTPGGDWFMKDLFDGKPYTVTLPSGLPAGSYLMRHEILALHTATTQGGAEFYPSCSQLQITGTTTQPLAAEVSTANLATFPGSYKATDPGILVPTVYDTGFDYSKLFPGPAIPPSFNTTGGGSGNNVPSPTSSMSTPTPTTTATTSTMSDDCGGYDPTSTYSSSSTSLSRSSTATPSVVAPLIDDTRYIVVTMTITVPPMPSPSSSFSSSSSSTSSTVSTPAPVARGIKRAYVHRSNRRGHAAIA